MDNATQLVGTWKLVSWTVMIGNGSVSFPYGKNPVGYLTYTSDGHMSAEIMNSDREQSNPSLHAELACSQTIPDADKVHAYNTYLSYCGRYTVDGETVTHHVNASLIPSWDKTEQHRPFRLAEGRLTIGDPASQILVWERA